MRHIILDKCNFQVSISSKHCGWHWTASSYPHCKCLETTTQCDRCLNLNLGVTCDFQQCGNLTSVDSDEPVQPPFKLRNSK